MATAMDTGISAKQRAAIAHGLSRWAADTYVLYLKTHGFHWNVEGPMFQTPHLMFMGQEAVARTVRSVLPVADEANDQPKLDLLTQRLDIHEKNAWMLRSLLKK
jgi:starvation-inducible DNA-binding protein